MLWWDAIKRDSETQASWENYIAMLRERQTIRLRTAKTTEEMFRAQGADNLITAIELEITAEEREAQAYADSRGRKG